jgi:hypothetical protein
VPFVFPSAIRPGMAVRVNVSAYCSRYRY